MTSAKREGSNPKKKTKAAKKDIRPDHISYSQIVTGKCLYRYLVTRILQTIPSENYWMRVGSFVHEVLHEYVKSGMEEGWSADAGTMEEVFEKHWQSARLKEEDYPDLRECMWAFAERGFDPETIANVEHAFQTDIGDGVIVAGRLDRVNVYKQDGLQVMEIIDYKHTGKIWSTEEVRRDLQLRIYRYMAMRHLWPGFDLVRVGVFHTRYNFLRWEGDPVPELEAAKDNDSIEQMLHRQWDRLIKTPTKDCVPEPGEHCWQYGGCPVLEAGKCPAYEDGKLEGGIEQEDIVSMVRAVRAWNLRVKTTRDRLKTMFQERAPMDVDGKRVGYKEVGSTSYPIVSFYPLAIDRGLSLDHVSVTETAVNKACGGKRAREKRDDLAELDAMAQRTKSTRFEC